MSQSGGRDLLRCLQHLGRGAKPQRIRGEATEDPGRARSESASELAAPRTPVPDSGSSVATDLAAPSQRQTRLQQGVIKPVDYKHITKYGLVCSTGEPGEPSTLEEALGDEK